MTTLVAALMAYFTGVAFLLLLDIRNAVYLEPLARAVWALIRPAPYAGRHRAPGRMTWSERIVLHAEREVSAIRRHTFAALMAEGRTPVVVNVDVLREDTQSLFLPVFVDEPPLCPPMYPTYDHALGAGRYAHLRVEELDAIADRDLRRAKVAVPA